MAADLDGARSRLAEASALSDVEHAAASAGATGSGTGCCRPDWIWPPATPKPPSAGRRRWSADAVEITGAARCEVQARLVLATASAAAGGPPDRMRRRSRTSWSVWASSRASSRGGSPPTSPEAFGVGAWDDLAQRRVAALLPKAGPYRDALVRAAEPGQVEADRGHGPGGREHDRPPPGGGQRRHRPGRLIQRAASSPPGRHCRSRGNVRGGEAVADNRGRMPRTPRSGARRATDTSTRPARPAAAASLWGSPETGSMTVFMTPYQLGGRQPRAASTASMADLTGSEPLAQVDAITAPAGRTARASSRRPVSGSTWLRRKAAKAASKPPDRNGRARTSPTAAGQRRRRWTAIMAAERSRATTVAPASAARAAINPSPLPASRTFRGARPGRRGRSPSRPPPKARRPRRRPCSIGPPPHRHRRCSQPPSALEDLPALPPRQLRVRRRSAPSPTRTGPWHPTAPVRQRHPTIPTSSIALSFESTCAVAIHGTESLDSREQIGVQGEVPRQVGDRRRLARHLPEVKEDRSPVRAAGEVGRLPVPVNEGVGNRSASAIHQRRRIVGAAGRTGVGQGQVRSPAAGPSRRPSTLGTTAALTHWHRLGPGDGEPKTSGTRRPKQASPTSSLPAPEALRARKLTWRSRNRSCRPAVKRRIRWPATHRRRRRSRIRPTPALRKSAATTGVIDRPRASAASSPLSHRRTWRSAARLRSPA